MSDGNRGLSFPMALLLCVLLGPFGLLICIIMGVDS